MKVYRGKASAARAYVEADRSRVDDYYLAEGTGLARRYTASPEQGAVELGMLDGDGYEAWVAGRDPDTGAPRGRLRQDAAGVRFVEITVNGPKTWSLAAALSPEVAAAYDEAQDRAAEQIIGWVAEHATTRVGPRGRQVQVPVEKLEAVTVRHYTSRAGDPHRHLHLQVNARVFAAGKWRGLHTVGFRDSIEALNGIGHAAVLCDPEFRGALAEAGFTLDPATGEVVQLEPFVGAFSERAAQIGRNIDSFEAQWRAANPGQEPGPAVRRSWDRRAWKQARPDKVVPADGAEMAAHWVEQLRELGYHDPTTQPGLPIVVEIPRVADLDRDTVVAGIVSRLGARRSAWNTADIRGQAEKAIAAAGLVADPRVRGELAEDLTSRAVRACVPLIERAGVPEHVRSLTSPHVLAVEADIVTRLANRTHTTLAEPALDADCPAVDGLDEVQQAAVAALAGQAGLVVVEGAAGAGKTTTLAAAQTLLTGQGRRMLVVTPTRKAAQVAAREVGAATSVAWLVHQHGYHWDPNGVWTRQPADPAPAAVLAPGDLLLVDEAGMLDQDTARALLTVADEMGTRVALVGDRHQLPAVGRGGVLDLAARWVTPQAHVELDIAHRFTDPAYSAISLALRTGTPTYQMPATPADQPGDETPSEPVGERVGQVWEALVRRGQIRIHPSEAERTHALTQLAANQLTGGGDATGDGGGGTLVMADTREHAAVLNGAIRDHLRTLPDPRGDASAGGDATSLVTAAGERIGVGDRVATRRNDRTLGVANRDTWTITAIADDGTLTLQGAQGGSRAVPAGYARAHVELAYATTVYGAQGETTAVGHLVIGEHTTAASAYVGMTRGREANVAHLVAEDLDQARAQWDEVFSRDRADLGPAHAAALAADDIDRYGPQQTSRPLEEILPELWQAWTTHADLEHRHTTLAERVKGLQQAVAIHARYQPPRDRLKDAEDTTYRHWKQAEQSREDLDQALATDTTQFDQQLREAWQAALPAALAAAETLEAGPGLFGQRHRATEHAWDDLTGFAHAWRPVHPDLAFDAFQIADQIRGLTGPRLTEALAAYTAHRVAAAHPDADQIRQHEHDTNAAYHHAHRARTEYEDTMWTLFREHGGYVYTSDPQTRLVADTEVLVDLDHQLAAATTHVQALEREPAIRALPSSALDSERQRWATDRHTTQVAKARQDREDRLHRPAPTHQSPSSGYHRPVDHGYGIGR
ncbi:MAG: MobF family relaxase [Nocardioidaceae bacterium]